jgi:hypothetical protein
MTATPDAVAAPLLARLGCSSAMTVPFNIE